MKFHRAIGLSLLVVTFAGIAANASAEGLTRAQVRQQLIEAENNGLLSSTDTSYPEVSPAFVQKAATSGPALPTCRWPIQARLVNTITSLEWEWSTTSS